MEELFSETEIAKFPDAPVNDAKVPTYVREDGLEQVDMKIIEEEPQELKEPTKSKISQKSSHLTTSGVSLGVSQDVFQPSQEQFFSSIANKPVPSHPELARGRHHVAGVVRESYFDSANQSINQSID